MPASPDNETPETRTRSRTPTSAANRRRPASTTSRSWRSSRSLARPRPAPTAAPEVARTRDTAAQPSPAPLSRRQRERQEAELRIRAEQDRQDGELFRVMLYSGLRIGEARARRVGDVTFLPDTSGAVLDVQLAFPAGTLKPPKSWKPRQVPVPRPAAEALARVLQLEHFTGRDDHVFVNRTGGALEDSAIRRRYNAAREAAGLHQVTLHSLRHAAGSIIAQSTGAVTARDILGHAAISTTNRYLHGKADARAVAAINAAFGVTA